MWSGGKASPFWPWGKENHQRSAGLGSGQRENLVFDPVGPSVYCHRAPSPPSAVPPGVAALLLRRASSKSRVRAGGAEGVNNPRAGLELLPGGERS